MKGKSWTKAQRDRAARLKEHGCIACIKLGLGPTPTEIHHLTNNTAGRISHEHTIPLCPWHHRGAHGAGSVAAESMAGPSLARSKPAFEAHFGTESALLAEVNERIGHD